MSAQPEALRLAELLAERPHDVLDFLPVKAAAELRRLHEENTALLKDLRFIADHDLRGADLTACGHIAHGLIGKARDAIKVVEGEKG